MYRPSCAQWLHYTAGDEARLCLDSRKLEPGDVFVALKGAKADGLSFVPVAVARRASCIVCENREDAQSKCAGLPYAEVPDLHGQLGPIASLYYGEPSKAMHGIAITGTNGKTSTSHWVAALLSRLGMSTAAIGTVGTFLDGKQIEEAGQRPMRRRFSSRLKNSSNGTRRPLLWRLAPSGLCGIDLTARQLKRPCLRI